MCFSSGVHYAAKQLFPLSNKWADTFIYFSGTHTDCFLYIKFSFFFSKADQSYVFEFSDVQLNFFQSYLSVTQGQLVQTSGSAVCSPQISLIERRCPKLRSVLHQKPFGAQWSGRIALLFLCLTVFSYISVKQSHFFILLNCC